MTETEKQALNGAILNVLETQFKKDMREGVVQLVEQAGYKVVKITGGYEVKNPATNKWVSIGYRHSYYRYIQNLGRDVRIEYGKKVMFDFINYLEKPVNREWYAIHNVWGWNTTPTQEKMSALRSAKSAIKSSDRDIANIQKQMEALQKKLIDEVRLQEERKQRLISVRKELGLNRR